MVILSNSGSLREKDDKCDPLRFSVVINTDNRIAYLKRTLSGLRRLTYPYFEVCVVAGPTPDGTREFLAKGPDDIKVAHCEVRNLSVSRNIGIAMSDGDIVVFIDDDSVPEPEWLADLAKSYTADDVGAVGGFVYDHTGLKFQARFVTTNRLGYPAEWGEPAPHLNFPYSIDVPHLLGTNCSFRKSALIKIGGFDEEYEYFLDETDVCCRINDAGFKIVQRSDGFVHHKYAPSHIRDEKRIISNWYPLIKNRIYFGLRNGRAHHGVDDIVGAGIGDARNWEHVVLVGAKHGTYSSEDVERFYRQADAAIVDGVERANQPAKLLTSDCVTRHFQPFLPYQLIRDMESRKVICFVTQDYPPEQNGGIARNISQLARSMAEEGHHVHVMTKARENASIDYEDGVWVHRVEIQEHRQPDYQSIAARDLPREFWNYSLTMLAQVADVDARRKVDAVYCPLWDCEAIAFLADGRFPLILALQTTMKLWLESRPDRLADSEWMRIFGDPIVETERMIMNNAEMIHANSRAIVDDLRRGYDVCLPYEKIYFSPHCMEDWASQYNEKDGGDLVRLLFVGRLESRKGIDVLLAVAPRILERFPNVVFDIVGDDTIPRADGGTYKKDFLDLELAPDIKSRVIFHGRVDEERLRYFYGNCDLLVAPSRYESFGLVYLEALMFGKPVIGGVGGGGGEVITDGETGLLVAPGDTDELEQAIVTLLSDAGLRAAMGRAARADYGRRFTVQPMVADLVSAIDLLAERRAK
ncbi:glycosyltransferase [Sphingomonas crocodyli]|uniref:Glycosyltransferase n=1 Tax=Sphingomonas crocodyli TaxID=1979270 RepID=A0A437MBB5_9SPHN|nr:glycosyltransferase [Sphingomonas crocodyli]RVT94941.1 glycosyltransferase [Sphingomonas crocodyli]